MMIKTLKWIAPVIILIATLILQVIIYMDQRSELEEKKLDIQINNAVELKMLKLQMESFKK